MNRPSLAPLVLLFAVSVTTHGQSVSRVPQLTDAASLSSEPKPEASDDRVVATCAIADLKRLARDVLVYDSLGDFEEDGRLARVPFEAFQNDLQEVTAEIKPLISRLPQGRLRTQIINALDSYRDGAFWWQKTYQPRVVEVSAPAFRDTTRTSSDTAFLGTVPYTVAIHWRQAGKYLKRAEEMMNGTRLRRVLESP